MGEVHKYITGRYIYHILTLQHVEFFGNQYFINKILLEKINCAHIPYTEIILENLISLICTTKNYSKIVCIAKIVTIICIKADNGSV